MNKIYSYFLIVQVFFSLSYVFADSLEIGIENDVFIHDDSDYSHGTQLKYTRESPLWKFDEWGIDVLQNMYTPNTINSTNIQYGDRPYCGLLLGSFYGDNSFYLWGGKLNIRNEFGIGSTGKNSFAEESQKVVHKIIGSKKPMGWTHQIAQEAIVQYQGYVDYNLPIVETGAFRIYDILRANAFVGTFKDQLALGTDFKLGINTKENMGGKLSFSASRNKETKRCRTDILFGVEGKYVAWDSSLDGCLFRDSEYTIESKDFVAEIHYGFEIQLYCVELDFIMVNRTKEYEGQDDAPDYCRLDLKFNF